jgi:hypothetical protein
MSSAPLVFSNSLLGFTNHYLTYGLFFLAGWFDLLGGYLPSLQFIDLGVAGSAWLGGIVGMMVPFSLFPHLSLLFFLKFFVSDLRDGIQS